MNYVRFAAAFALGAAASALFFVVLLIQISGARGC